MCHRMSKLGKEGQNGHFWNCLSDTKDKTQIVLVFFKPKEQKKKKKKKKRERQQWDAVGGFAWVPDLGSFLKLREVGISPYLGFTLYLSVFQCFG